MAALRCANPISTAKCLEHLSRQHWSFAPRSQVLDFLLPPLPQLPRSCPRPGLQLRILSNKPSCNATNPRRTRVPAAIQARRFSSTPSRLTTHAIYNPQTDDDGHEMKLEITPRAANRLSEVMAKDNNPHLALRIQVESGGCHGLQYLMSLVTLPEALPQASSVGQGGEEETGGESDAIRDDDTIFTYSTAGGGDADLTAPKIILDTPSLEFLKGSKIDFTMELIGSQFKIVDNPHATSSCGCGTSFDIKI